MKIIILSVPPKLQKTKTEPELIELVSLYMKEYSIGGADVAPLLLVENLFC